MIQKKRPLYFRVDGHTQIGLGHLTRCLSLAEYLDDLYEAHFICSEETRPYLDGHQIHSPLDLEKLPARNLVVIDGYGFDQAYRKELGRYFPKRVLIDDLFQGDEKELEGYINQSQALTCAPFPFLSGVENAMLRKEFFLAKKAPRLNKLSSACLMLGGGDPKNLSEKLLKSCLKSGLFSSLTLILGPAKTDRERYQFFQQDYVRILQSLGPRELCETLIQHDVLFCPPSVSSIEASFLGVPLVLMPIADNQAGLALQWKKKKIDLFFDNLENCQEIDLLNFLGAQVTLSKLQSIQHHQTQLPFAGIKERYQKFFKALE